MYRIDVFFNDDGTPFSLYELNEIDVHKFKHKLYDDEKFIEWSYGHCHAIFIKSNITVVKIINEGLEKEESDE